MKRRWKQIDVFGARAFAGNPLAVVLDGAGLGDAEMAAIARWTNLSETTFLLPPVHGGDYRVRIFNPGGEMPFAGHPTLGSAHAFIEAGGQPRQGPWLIQECGAGPVKVRIAAGADGSILGSLEAPPVSSMPVGAEAVATLLAALAVERPAAPPLIMDVGPRWLVLDLGHGEQVARLAPDLAQLAQLSRTLGMTGVTVFGRIAGQRQLRVRTFAPAAGVPEDPACGSGNVCVAAYLLERGALVSLGHDYTAVQGQEIGRDARIQMNVRPGERGQGAGGARITMAGRTQTLVDGTLDA